jgi:hypothetical protein
MALYPVFHRWSTTPIVLVEAGSFPRALELAVERGVRLLYCDLKGVIAPGAMLCGADLRGADMSSTVLSGVNLEEADLRTTMLMASFLQEALLSRADLRDADLRRADLRVANLEKALLVGADLRGALFYGARFEGAILDWRFRGIPLELLRQGRTGQGSASEAVAAPAKEDDERPFAWLKELLIRRSKADWALDVLSRYVRPGDNAPELLRRLAADALSLEGTPARTSLEATPSEEDQFPVPGRSPKLWTRRHAAHGTPIVCRRVERD